MKSLPVIALLFACHANLHAATYTLDDPASPTSAVFDTTGGRLTVTQKSDSFVWKNTTTSGGDAVTVGAVTQADATHLSAALTHTSSGQALTVALELVPASGDLRVTLSGSTAAIPNGVQYPYAFHPVGHGSNGFAVLPLDSGYVLPESQTSYVASLNVLNNRRMEWFGGTDRDNVRGWLGIVETHADFNLRTATGMHDGVNVIGAVPRWVGSNDNAAHTPNLLSYDRTVRFRFLASGGYVALAKQFRAWAQTQGWVKTLAQKNAEDPEHKTDKFIGAPVIYLWGDGRDEGLIDELYAAGLRKAALQISVNQLDQNKNFPNTAHANGSGWMDAARAKGFLPGFYDIYTAMRIGGNNPPYDGTVYLWPTAQAEAWAFRDSAGNPVTITQGPSTLYDISYAKSAEFCANTRLPAHLSQFGMDAYFFDVVCASSLNEDYDSANGHFATRTIDLGNRLALLNAAYANPTKRLVTGTEQGRSWAVPVVHWAEGKFWLGETGNLTNTDSGPFNNSSYPTAMVDVVDPTMLTTNKLGPLLSHGWQAPLWDLVFHDCMVNTVHWSRPHNKFLYAWDHADRAALLRGQPPLLNMTRTGAPGTAARTPTTLTDTFGTTWSSRWSDMSSRFTQTFNTVCAWAEQVGYLEMLDHSWLTADRSVQTSEFSNDGGASGRGVVVNFGMFDGAFGVTGTTWTGTRRGQSLTVPVGGYQTYTWGGLVVEDTPPPALQSGTAYTHTFTAAGASGAVTWAVVSGALPPGLMLSDAGVLSGTPTTADSYTFTVQATDGLGMMATQSFTLVVAGGPQTVTLLAALHHYGQTYLTWNEVADASATYRIYRSASPFMNTSQLNSGNLIGTASADSSYDERLSTLRSTTFHYRITAAGPDLTSTHGLFVHTPTEDGAAFYAVTAVISGIEQIAIASGQSTTASAVSETVAMPEPVFQRSLTISSRTVDVYVHWVGATATPFYPAMGNKNSVAHHLGLVRRGPASTHSLLIRPHARQGSFLSTVTGTNDVNEWVLTLDDWMPNDIANTFWYGYHEAFDIDTGLPQPTSGTVHDYTTRRAKWEIEWALRTLPIDTNRVYMTGHSMGGIGSFFLSIMMRDRIAAIWTTSAKFDFSFLNDPNPMNIWNAGSNERADSGDIMWGTVATDLPSSEGIPVYDRLNAGHLAQAFRGDDLPVFISFNGKNDFIVGWAEKLGFYQALAASRHGGMYYFDSGVHNRSGGEWVPQQSVNALNRYRLDQSYPAFTNSTANGNPGNGAATNGDAFGTINGNLDWDASSIVDTASQWQIRLFTTALTSTAGTVAAPASATVDVTPRRLQTFNHTAGRAARYEVRDASNALLKQGLVVADADGLFIVPAVPVNTAGTTLTLSTVFQEILAITTTAGGFELTWPTTIGVRYQVGWSPGLDQWISIGTPTIATSSSMSWTDDGSLTGASPLTAGKRFYRLLISE